MRESDNFHNQLIVIDALEFCNWNREVLEHIQRGGLTAIHVTVAVWENCRDTLLNIAKWHRLFEQHGDLVVPGRSVENIHRAKAEGKTAVIFGFQNSSPLEDDFSLVQIFHDLGVRVIQLTYNNQSLIGSSCYEKVDTGISRFGREVIREMNRVGMIVDVSHCGERTGFDAIEFSERPIAITHANPKWFHDGLRNKSKDLLRTLAESGGMLGLSLYPLHIGGGDTPLKKVCQMVTETVDLMGIDHVGFGTDAAMNWQDDFLDWIRSGRWKRGIDLGEGSATNLGWPEWPAWFRTPADFPNLTAGLLDQGFSREDVAKIMGGNWLRFFEEGFAPVANETPAIAARGAKSV